MKARKAQLQQYQSSIAAPTGKHQVTRTVSQVRPDLLQWYALERRDVLAREAKRLMRLHGNR